MMLITVERRPYICENCPCTSKRKCESDSNIWASHKQNFNNLKLNLDSFGPTKISACKDSYSLSSSVNAAAND